MEDSKTLTRVEVVVSRESVVLVDCQDCGE